MQSFIKLYSSESGEIYKFLKSFYSKNINIDMNTLEWKQQYPNPIEISDILGTFIENNDKYNINMWICLDKDFLINVTDNNADDIIRYLYERFPN